ncbi:energy-coupling factor transport system ATP-binding protein [Paenibacillus uliginis N3/975]|uniref:Energy-coupling factor transport system ATP-binding protein n=1 Tax=Paenibacillus uliginis N3/975 TaxID=1313296 RepID=A0A1X7HTW7_9BACL|nr:ATP-binding cassette domain-containing protein [Paenibacillus uliginis]SMF92253.1 energy-coupling factor transport system ATP-binding protein [Paenibacillus uliginis N3/975]
MGIYFCDVSYTHAKRTPMEHRAVKCITLSIPDGQIIAIMGSSGSGKSTLGQICAGLLKPDKGTVYVDNIPIDNRKIRSQLRNKIAYVSQFPEHQLFEETVFLDIGFGLRRMKYSDHKIITKVKKTMELVGLDFERYKDRSPFQLSGGEQRLAALAGALIKEPNIVILDEPTVGLDPLARMKFHALLTFLKRTRRISIVYITHDLQDALEHADRLIILHNGELVYDLKATSIQRVLEHPGIPLFPTPLLRLVKELEFIFPEIIDSEIVQENKLLTYVTERLIRN